LLLMGCADFAGSTAGGSWQQLREHDGSDGEDADQ